MNLFLKLFPLLLSFPSCHNQISEEHTSTTTPTTAPQLYDTTSPFTFAQPQEMNRFGIFPTIMVQLEFKAFEKLHLWRTNKAFTTQEMVDGWEELCAKQHNFHHEDGEYLQWGNCTFSDTQLTALIEEGKVEPWHKNFSYFEIKTKPFQVNKGDQKKVCILNEFRDRKAYIVLMTSVHALGVDWSDHPLHKLDMFLPKAMEFFEDVIEMDKVLQFGPLEALNPNKRYKCLVGIASGESNEELKINCRFKCVDKTELRDQPDLRKVDEGKIEL